MQKTMVTMSAAESMSSAAAVSVRRRGALDAPSKSPTAQNTTEHITSVFVTLVAVEYFILFYSLHEMSAASRYM